MLIDDAFNASIMQTPRLGVFGWYRSYLVIGLPLLQLFIPEQFRAVLAHEFGHLSGNHGRFGSWVYRIFTAWEQLMARLWEEQHWSAFVFIGFFNWYMPFFGAYTFILRRWHEFEADQCAAQLTGLASVGEALLATPVIDRYLGETYWPGVFKRADEEPVPPAAVFTEMSRAVSGGVSADQAREWIDEALAELMDYSDVHPSLSERLRGIGYSLPAERNLVRLPLPTESAAARYLGDLAEDLARKLDASWQQGISELWAARYSYAVESKAKLRELEAKAQQQPLLGDEPWELARLTAEFGDRESTVPLLRQVLAAHPGHAAAHYLLGEYLLEQRNRAGIDHLNQAMQYDPQCVLDACRLIYDFLIKQGEHEEAALYLKRARGHSDLEEKAQEERSRILASDQLLPHELTDEQMAVLREQLSRFADVDRAYIVRKAVRYFPERPCYIIGVAMHTAWYKLRSESAGIELIDRLSTDVATPGYTLFVLLDGDMRYLKKKMEQVPGALIVERQP